MTTLDGSTLDLEARYKVDQFPGIAFHLLGWDTNHPHPEPMVVCATEGCDHEDEDCWAWSEPEPEESEEWVRVVMVGDDTVHAVELTDLTPLPEDAYCHQCGQVGCTHDGRAS